MIFGMPSALFPAMAAHRFGDASLVGYLYMAPAAGALLVSLLSGPLRHVRRQGLGVVVTASLLGIGDRGVRVRATVLGGASAPLRSPASAIRSARSCAR